MREKHTEATLTALLRAKYSGQKWAFASQVADGTGYARSRTADGLAMGLWPSEGLHLHGFEIKVSRSDWLKEIQDPTKSLAFSRHCHFWWIVAPADIVKVEELPAEWGLQCPTTAGNLRVKKAASHCPQPVPVDHDFLAAIFRACLNNSPGEAEIAAARKSGYDAGYSKGKEQSEKWGETDRTRAERELSGLKKSLADFEVASGITINMWDGRNLGNAVKLVTEVGIGGILNGLQNVKVQAEKIAERAGEAETAFQSIKIG